VSGCGLQITDATTAPANGSPKRRPADHYQHDGGLYRSPGNASTSATETSESQSNMTNCRAGHPNPAGQLFCGQCGSRIADDASGLSPCSCGRDSVATCQSCGERRCDPHSISGRTLCGFDATFAVKPWAGKLYERVAKLVAQRAWAGADSGVRCGQCRVASALAAVESIPKEWPAQPFEALIWQWTHYAAHGTVPTAGWGPDYAVAATNRGNRPTTKLVTPTETAYAFKVDCSYTETIEETSVRKGPIYLLAADGHEVEYVHETRISTGRWGRSVRTERHELIHKELATEPTPPWALSGPPIVFDVFDWRPGARERRIVQSLATDHESRVAVNIYNLVKDPPSSYIPRDPVFIEPGGWQTVAPQDQYAYLFDQASGAAGGSAAL
jgi:hypothetical protein